MNTNEIKSKISEIEDYANTTYSMIEDIESSLKNIRDNLQNIVDFCSDASYELGDNLTT
jgi:methyl-accepting chemotaxis protein